jgi:hypothetical protein
MSRFITDRRLTNEEFILCGKFLGRHTDGIIPASLFAKKLLPLNDSKIETIFVIAKKNGIKIIKNEDNSKSHLLLDFSQCK